MAFPAPHYVFTFGGPLGTQEQWSTSLRLSGFTAAGDEEGEQTALAALMAKVNAAWGGSQQIVVSSAAPVTWGKYNHVGVDGKYTQQYTNVLDQAPVGGSQPAKFPPQVSLVVTLRTAAARGLASKGRIFLPSPSIPHTGSDVTIAANHTETVAVWAQSLINGINEVPDVGGVIVASKVRTGAMRAVTSIDVGSVFDTMRSRRAKLLEARHALPVTGDLDGGGGDF